MPIFSAKSDARGRVLEELCCATVAALISREKTKRTILFFIAQDYSYRVTPQPEVNSIVDEFTRQPTQRITTIGAT